MAAAAEAEPTPGPPVRPLLAKNLIKECFGTSHAALAFLLSSLYLEQGAQVSGCPRLGRTGVGTSAAVGRSREQRTGSGYVSREGDGRTDAGRLALPLSPHCCRTHFLSLPPSCCMRGPPFSFLQECSLPNSPAPFTLHGCCPTSLLTLLSLVSFEWLGQGPATAPVPGPQVFLTLCSPTASPLPSRGPPPGPPSPEPAFLPGGPVRQSAERVAGPGRTVPGSPCPA